MPIEQVGFTEERKKMLEYRMERAIKAEGVTIGCDGACLDIMVFADEITLVFTMSPEEAMFFAMQIMDTVMTTQD